MLFEDIESFKKFGACPKIPEYISENLKFPLYEWQKVAIENFLINENKRNTQIQAGEKLQPNHLMFNMATGSGKTLVMAALILYYYKEFKITNFIFFVNQNAIVGKTQDNFIHKSHAKYLFKENIIIDGKRINIKEVEQFSNSTDAIQIKFTTIQKLHNDIYKENENSLLLSDLQKRNLVLIGDEAHHLNATTNKKETAQNEMQDISLMGKLNESPKEDDLERSWETTVCHHILYKGKEYDSQNKNVLLEFTATVPETDSARNKYDDKIIIKFGLKEFVNAGCTKHIRLVRSSLDKKERILQALVLNWYRFEIALKNNIPNFKPVILFRSKTIEESKQDYLEFVELCHNIKASDLNFIKSYSKYISTDGNVSAAYTAGKDIFEKIKTYNTENEIKNSRIADYIHENFQERNCIITNSSSNKTKTEKTDSEIDRLLNSLEDVHNHIRAVFTVQRLTEGWDVLNLYDIVRLYHGRDTDYKAGKVGKSTTSEVQLIGRGVRYYPFAYQNKMKNRRKFDNDVTNELRVLEEFYFHSDDDHRYISDLSEALKKSELIHDDREEKKFKIKDDIKKDLDKMYLFCNERKDNPKRKLKTLPDDFAKLNFSYVFDVNSSYITSVNMNGDDEENVSTQKTGKTFSCSINEISRHVLFKALHQLNSDLSSYFNFENISKRFNVSSMEEFIKFINSIPLSLTFYDEKNIETEEPVKLLQMAKEFFCFCQRELEKYDHPYIGTDFKLVPFADFQFETTRMINTSTNEKTENLRVEKECRSASWYALDSFWGTSEERNLIEFIRGYIRGLEEKYDRICLLRNEEVYKIFDFDTGEGFQPDFLLLLRGKDAKQKAYFQIFIEPKGKHLAGDDNDGWKEKFLLRISKEYGLKKPIVAKSEKYLLFGLPFFNESDSEMKNKFEKEFQDLLKVKSSVVEYDDNNNEGLMVADDGRD